MRVEPCKKLSASKWRWITSRRPVVCRVPPPEKSQSPGPNAPGPPGRIPRLSSDNTLRISSTWRGPPPSGPGRSLI